MSMRELRGERVWLRPVQRSDAVALATASHVEIEAGFQADVRVPMSILSFESWIAGIGKDEIVFAVCRTGEDRCIGTMSIRDIDRVNQTAETGSGMLDAGDRGHGLGTEAKRLLLQYAFEELGLHAVRSSVFEGNGRSIRALEKQGYRLAGRLTGNMLAVGGVIGDTLLYDMIRDDWEQTTGRT